MFTEWFRAVGTLWFDRYAEYTTRARYRDWLRSWREDINTTDEQIIHGRHWFGPLPSPFENLQLTRERRWRSIPGRYAFVHSPAVPTLGSLLTFHDSGMGRWLLDNCRGEWWWLCRNDFDTLDVTKMYDQIIVTFDSATDAATFRLFFDCEGLDRHADR